MTMGPRSRTHLLQPFICTHCRGKGRTLLRRQSRNFATSPSTSSAAPPSGELKYLQLTNRTLIRLAGPDAANFLFNLVPARILGTGGSSRPIYTAFLSAHGRILNDVFIYPPTADDGANGEEWFVEVDSDSAGDLMKHLRKHKLRAKFQLDKVDPGKMGVYYNWPSSSSSSAESARPTRGGQDPRPGMGLRWLDDTTTATKPEAVRRLEDKGAKAASLQDYTIHRILNGIAEGQTELPAAGSLPQESNIDFFGGIDFMKGCYLGQELTIRTHHTGVVRKRILPCQLYEGDQPLSSDQPLPVYEPDTHLPMPPSQSNISKLNARGRGRSSGKWLSGVGNIGLALCRLEMMTDIQLTADTSNYDPKEQYKVQWEVEGQEGKQEVMIKPFVPQWLRDGVEQNLRRKERKSRPVEEQDEDEEVD
ncbi:ccr4 associated factor [Exophiala oligosperma]